MFPSLPSHLPFATIESYSEKEGPANKPVHQHKVYQNNVDLGHKENLGDYQDAHQLPPCNASKATKHSRMW